MGNMKLTDLPLDGMRLVDTRQSCDSRGCFERVYCANEWSQLRDGLVIAQVNISTTTYRGTIRGMHFQHPAAAEAKLIRCVRGRVYDVAVDLRRASPTFLQWHAVELGEDVPSEVFIPEGFAHGFQTLSDDVQLLYFHTAPWSPECEGGIRFDDPMLSIKWPLAPSHVSSRDRSHAFLTPSYSGWSE